LYIYTHAYIHILIVEIKICGTLDIHLENAIIIIEVGEKPLQFLKQSSGKPEHLNRKEVNNMTVKCNPILDFKTVDRTVMKKTCALCEELIGALAAYTITDNSCIACADNGEVFVTENELYEVIDIIGRMVRITDEAPCDYDTMHKQIAVNFIELGR
jgi:hypothetical protein